MTDRNQIRYDLPVPKKRGGKNIHPWYELGVGGSFFVPNTTAGVLLTGAKNWALRNSVSSKYTARSLEEGGVKGARIWRVS